MPLEKAIKKKRTYICKLNIAHSDDKNPDNQKGKTTLHWAASWGHTELCLPMIDNTEDKNPSDDPLLEAAIGGHTEVCQLIISQCG